MPRVVNSPTRASLYLSSKDTGFVMEMDAGAHTVHNLHYHVVWVPKYRRRLLEGRAGLRAEQVIRHVAGEYGFTVDTLKVSPDHIHLLVRLQPRQGIADAVRTLKSITARTLFQEFPELKRHLWKGSLWADGYCANTVGGLNLDAVRRYIQQEQGETPP